MRLQFTPQEVKSVFVGIKKNVYLHVFSTTVDNIQYKFKYSIKADVVTINCSFDCKLTQDILKVHTEEEHIIKMFLTVDYIINKYVRRELIRVENQDVKELIFEPALDIRTKAISLQRRNKMYIKAIDDFLLNNHCKFNVKYNGNKIIFTDILKKPFDEHFKIYDL